jgi:hypothetical protein
VPYADSALRSSKIIKNAKFVIYKGAPYVAPRNVRPETVDYLVSYDSAKTRKSGSRSGW